MQGDRWGAWLGLGAVLLSGWLMLWFILWLIERAGGIGAW